MWCKVVEGCDVGSGDCGVKEVESCDGGSGGCGVKEVEMVVMVVVV